MKNKVKKIVDHIADILIKWKDVRAVVLQHFAEKDVYDPNFSITFDVFCDGSIPASKERSGLFVGSEYFESSKINNKDRFIFEELPVRISYKPCEGVENVFEAVKTDRWLSIEGGTYLFHRIATGTLLWSRDEWIKNILIKLDKLPESFWQQWIESCKRRIDHYLEDLGAATIKDDALYFQLSLAGFLQSTARFLFAVNHVFEPGPRDYTASLVLLENLPEGFEANWSSILRNDAELPAFRKHEIAEILTRSILNLSPQL